MDLLEYLRLVRRRWRLLVVCILAAGVAAFVTTPAEPSRDQVSYRATHQLLRDPEAPSPQATATVALYVKSGEVPARVAERIGFEGEPAALSARVDVEIDERLGTLDITARGNSPRQAAERANAFAEATLGYLGEQTTDSRQEDTAHLEEQLTGLETEIDSLDSRLATAAAAGQSTGTLEAERDALLRQYGATLERQREVLGRPPPTAGYLTLQEALPELARVEGGGFAAPASRAERTALGVALGALLALAAVAIAERLDARVHDIAGVTGAFGLPVIAEVPKRARTHTPRIDSVADPLSSVAEAYRNLRSSLLLTPTTVLGDNADAARPGPPQVVLVTSPAPGEGKTTTVANLATTMAEAGRTVLVLACDFRRPEVHRHFDVPLAPGLAEALTSERSNRLEDVARPTAVPGVWVAPSGEGLRNLGDLASAGRDLVAEARQLADLVVIDTAPILATNDATELVPACDAVVLVCRVGSTRLDASRRCRQLLERLGAPVAGVVAIGVPAIDSQYAGYYTTGKRGKPPSTPGHLLSRTIPAEERDERIDPGPGSPSPSRQAPGTDERRARSGEAPPAHMSSRRGWTAPRVDTLPRTSGRPGGAEDGAATGDGAGALTGAPSSTQDPPVE